MNMLQAVLMGLLQGLTEFLPVSSSGHLVIGGKLLNIEQSGILLDVCLHFGTLVAVCIFFWPQIRDILTTLGAVLLRKKTKDHKVLRQRRKNLMLLLCIIVSCIPTAIIGLVLEHYSDVLFNSVKLVGALLLVTGIILWLAPRRHKTPDTAQAVNPKKALIIGLVQGLAVLPGISRSGSTIAASLFLGLSREEAARFSFLISVPAILGATLLEMLKLRGDTIATELLPAMVGAVVAGVSGYFALRFFIKLLNKGKLYYFSIYCWILGLAALLFI